MEEASEAQFNHAKTSCQHETYFSLAGVKHTPYDKWVQHPVDVQKWVKSASASREDESPFLLIELPRRF